MVSCYQPLDVPHATLNGKAFCFYAHHLYPITHVSYLHNNTDMIAFVVYCLSIPDDACREQGPQLSSCTPDPECLHVASDRSAPDESTEREGWVMLSHPKEID